MGSKRLVVLASGEGSTFRAIAEASQQGRIPADVVGLGLSREGAGALVHAHELGVPSVVISPAACQSRLEWDQKLTDQVRDWKPHWIALAGFTQLLGPEFLKAFEGKVVNTHPSLLPKFGGAGMYGMKVHEAVLRSGEAESGVTVHVVTADYDTGPIIAQKTVKVLDHDTAESLAVRLKEVEKEFYISVLARLLAR